MTRTTEIRAVVFDLDGTLYPGTATLEYYISSLFDQKGIINTRDRIYREAMEILEGTHRDIQIGTYVKGEAGTVSFQSRDGDEDTSDEELDRSWLYLGDSWTVAYFLTRSYGFTRDMYVRAFHESRYAMSAGRLTYRPSGAMTDFLEHLRSQNIYTVMQTNSSDDSGAPTLEFLGVASAFDEYIYSAEKPEGMETLFRRLDAEHDIAAHQVVSVGDHPWNDIHAARKLGGQTLMISPFQGFDASQFAPRVRTVSELIETLSRQIRG